MIPKNHPRRVSLEVRHRLVEGFRRGFVAEAGLIAHGRGEAFDYLLGEETVDEALRAEEAAVALLLLAEKPVLSVNGNVAALVPGEAVGLAGALGAEIEVNLFYRTAEREKLIARVLRDAGAKRVFGLEKKHCIKGLSSERANVDDALWSADVVLVCLEDGDRTDALKRCGKRVVAVDLNPLSRTAHAADVTVVDNVVRAFPNMVRLAGKMGAKPKKDVESLVSGFDNRGNLGAFEVLIRSGFKAGD